MDAVWVPPPEIAEEDEDVTIDAADAADALAMATEAADEEEAAAVAAPPLADH